MSRGPKKKHDPDPKLSTDPLPPSVRQAIEHVEAWAAGEARLNQNTASSIREIIRNAVVERCAWNTPLMPEPTSEALRRAWPVGSAVVSIEGAYGQREETGAAPIRFLPSPENAVFFEGLLLRTKAKQVQTGGKAWRRLAGYAERYQGRLQQQVIGREFLADDLLALGMQASLIGATLAGKALPDMSDAELLAVVFDDGASWDRETRPPAPIHGWRRCGSTGRHARNSSTACGRDSGSAAASVVAYGCSTRRGRFRCCG